MQVIHRLVGYDKLTDRQKQRFDVPDDLLPDAKKIAHVPSDDPDAAWSYPLSARQTRELARLIGAAPDLKGAEFFLEAFAQEPG